MLAAKSGSIKVVQMLIDQNADVNAQVSYGFLVAKQMVGMTALLCAINFDQPEIAKYLINLDLCDLDQQKEDGTSALMMSLVIIFQIIQIGAVSSWSWSKFGCFKFNLKQLQLEAAPNLKLRQLEAAPT